MSTAEQIREAIDSAGACRVRTRFGRWRDVVAVYSDDTFGTTLEGLSVSRAGSWRVLDANEIAHVEAIAVARVEP